MIVRKIALLHLFPSSSDLNPISETPHNVPLLTKGRSNSQELTSSIKPHNGPLLTSPRGGTILKNL